MSDVPLKPSFLHRFWSKKCASTFCREISNKNIQFSKWEIWIFNAILDQTKLWRARLWIRIYFNSFLNLLFKVSAIQCNVECRLIAWGRDMQADVILKDPPTPWVPPPSGGAWVGGADPPSYAPGWECMSARLNSLSVFMVFCSHVSNRIINIQGVPRNMTVDK